MRTALGIGILLAGTVMAAPASATGNVVTHEQAVSAQDQQAVLAYWTPERIKIGRAHV